MSRDRPGGRCRHDYSRESPRYREQVRIITPLLRLACKSQPHAGDIDNLVAEIPVLPGCISQGRTKEEALANIKEAAELCLESMNEEGWTLPREYTVDQVEVSA